MIQLLTQLNILLQSAGPTPSTVKKGAVFQSEQDKHYGILDVDIGDDSATQINYAGVGCTVHVMQDLILVAKCKGRQLRK